MRWGVLLSLSAVVLVLVTLLSKFYSVSVNSGSKADRARDELEDLLYEGPEFLSENETFDTNITTDAPTEMPFLAIDVKSRLHLSVL